MGLWSLADGLSFFPSISEFLPLERMRHLEKWGIERVVCSGLRVYGSRDSFQ